MTIFLGFLLPLLLFTLLLIVQVGRGKAHTTSAPVIAAFLLVGVWSSLAVYWVYSWSGPWKNPSEIAWVGTGTGGPGKTLRIGGDDPSARCGWPSEGFSPAMSIMPTGAGKALITIRNGGGALSVPKADLGNEGAVGDRILGAEQVTSAAPMILDGRKITLRESGVIFRKRNLDVAIPELEPADAAGIDLRKLESEASVFLNANGWVMAAKGITPNPSDTPAALPEKLERQLAFLRSRGGKFARAAGAIEAWSTNIQFYCRDVPPAWLPRWVPIRSFDRTEILALGRESAGSATIKIPSGAVVLLKPGKKIRMRILPSPEGGIDALFLPPWRVASPLPPEDPRWQFRKGAVRLTIAASPKPDDACFLLPMTGDLAETRFDRTLTGGGPASMVFAQDGSESYGQGRGARKINIPEKLGWSGITSVTRLTAGDTSFLLATVQDLPQRWRVLFGLLAALTVPLYGLYRFVPRRLGHSLHGMWMTTGILAVAWVMLCIRLLLSLRYALSPSGLDGVAIRSVGCAFAVMPLAMAAIIVFAGCRYAWRPSKELESGERRAIFRGLFATVIGAWVLAWVEYHLATRLWGNIPDYYYHIPASWRWSVFIGLPAGLLAWIMVSSRGRNEFPMLALHWFERLCIHVGPNLWDRARKRDSGILSSLLMVMGLLAIGVLLLSFAFGITSSNFAFVSELLGSGILISIGALWLGGKARRVREVSWWATFSLSVMMVGALFVFPIIFRDVGALYAAVGIFLPLCAILVASRPYRAGVVAVAGLVLGVLLVSTIYFNWQIIDPVLGAVPLGEVRSRVLTFKLGEGILGDVVGFPVVKGEDGPSAWKIRNAVQHTWGNKAMAHLGGWFGNGFGQSPAAQLQIREQTLRYDSVFSCYILAEYGFLGGASLLLIGGIPLLIVLLAKPVAYRQGYAFAVLLASAFCFDGVIHAAMNLGLLPFTGRNYPLLSVVSASDFLHWTLVLAIASQVFFWDDSTDGGESSQSSPIKKERSPHVLLGAGILIAVWFCFRMQYLIKDPGLEHFDWSSTIDRVENLIHAKAIAWDEGRREVVVNGAEIKPLSTLGQEISRFNFLPAEEKLGQPNPGMIEAYMAGVGKLRTPAAFDAFLRSLAVQSPIREREGRPPLFQVISGPPTYLDDLEGTYQTRAILTTNPAYNNSIELRQPHQADELPTVRIGRDEGISYILRSNLFSLSIPTEWNEKGDIRIVRLLLKKDGSVSMLQDSNPGRGRGDIYLTSERSRKSKLLMRFEAQKEGLIVGGGAPLVVDKSEKKVGHTGATKSLIVEPGAGISVAGEDPRGQNLRFVVGTTKGRPMIGPAWVMGKWELAADNRLDLPWDTAFRKIALHHGTGNGKAFFEEVAGTLTVDPGLHAAAQQFVRERGRRLFAETLENASLPKKTGKGVATDEFRRFLPPRVAIAIVDIPGGEVLALAGWPRPKHYSSWSRLKDGEEIPPLEWLENKAPRSLRSRYAVDHNFDRMLMGSSTKPIWAAGILALNPGLSERFCVRGSSEAENSLFGIRIPGRSSWKVGSSHSVGGREWCDFDSYLSRSDNRYQILLGFLGLAASDRGQILSEEGISPSVDESMDGGKYPWRKYPKFPDSLRFSRRAPQALVNLDQAPLFAKLWEMFRIGYKDTVDAKSRPARSRQSFWTRDPGDDVVPIEGAPVEEIKRYDRERILAQFGAISPEAVNFALDRPPLIGGDTLGYWTPRQYISLLLGGGNNAWANVDFAGAFATTVMGCPVVPHITAGEGAKDKTSGDARQFLDVARRLRPGLADVLVHGTAVEHAYLSKEARGFLKSLGNVKAYAKTGTLHEPDYSVSRIAVALVKWKDKNESEAEKGLVFSVVVEDGKTGAATEWFGDFVLRNREAIRRRFREK